MENLAITFPFAVGSLFTDNWFCFPALALVLLFVPYLKFTIEKKTYFASISSIIPATDFEWIMVSEGINSINPNAWFTECGFYILIKYPVQKNDSQ